MQTLKKNIKKGFTLIELLLYISLISVIVAILSTFLVLMINFQQKQQVINKIEQQGLQITQLITQTIRNAENINTPSNNSSDSELSLKMKTKSDNPTIFSINQNTIQITEGKTKPIPLQSSEIIIQNLIFKNLSLKNTSGSIQISFDLIYQNPDNLSTLDYRKTFRSTANIR